MPVPFQFVLMKNILWLAIHATNYTPRQQTGIQQKKIVNKLPGTIWLNCKTSYNTTNLMIIYKIWGKTPSSFF